MAVSKEEKEYSPATINIAFTVLKDNEKLANIFAVESNKMLKTIPHNSTTKKLWAVYAELNNNIDKDELLDDLIQDTWVYFLEKQKEIDTNKIASWMINAARFVLLRNIKTRERELNRIVEYNLEDISYYMDFDGLNEEELREVANNINAVPNDHKHQKIWQVEKKSFRKLAEFNSAVDACNSTGIDKGNLSACLSHKRKTAGGYVWLYSNDEMTKLVKN